MLKLLAWVVPSLLVALVPALSSAPVQSASLAEVSGPPCSTLEIARSASVEGFISDRYFWSDAACRHRSAALVRNDVQDPAGKWGGYLRQFVYDVDGGPRVVSGSGDRYPGFGIIVSHFGNSYYASHSAPGAGYGIHFAGRHHAIHEFKSRLTLDGRPVDATVHWFMATGRDHPVWSVTFDSSPAGPDAVMADTRAPYGELQWDGGANSVVDGIEWGDRFVFRTVSQPLSFQSRWDYTRANRVPFNNMWSSQPDSAMGLVQTQTVDQHDAGGYWAYGLRGKTSEAPDLNAGLLEPGGIMPASWNWTFQLNQFEIPFQVPRVTSRRLAWGSNYGAVGQTQYAAYGDDRKLNGYPYQSYSVFVVLGKHSATPVTAQVNQIETVQDTRLHVRTGKVAVSGPAGVGRPDWTVYDPPGYNHVFSTWEVEAHENAVDLDINVGAGSLLNPIVVLSNYTAGSVPERVTLNGQPLVMDVDYFPSLDSASGKVWLTLRRALVGSTSLTIAP